MGSRPDLSNREKDPHILSSDLLDLGRRASVFPTRTTRRSVLSWLIKFLGIIVILTLLSLLWTPPSWAGLNDDRYEGNIFALYGANGALIPPKVTVEQSLQRQTPAVLVYYIDDSKDCKQFASVIGNLQVRYGLGVNFIAYAVDGLDLDDADGPGRYYRGQVPQTLIFNPSGEIAYAAMGNRPLVEVENAIRAIFDLEPISADDRQARSVNEVQTGYGTRSTPDLTPGDDE